MNRASNSAENSPRKGALWQEKENKRKQLAFAFYTEMGGCGLKNMQLDGR
jgi:hypothetical protein